MIGTSSFKKKKTTPHKLTIETEAYHHSHTPNNCTEQRITLKMSSNYDPDYYQTVELHSREPSNNFIPT